MLEVGGVVAGRAWVLGDESLVGVGVVDGATGRERCEGEGVEGGCGLVMPSGMRRVLAECFVHCGQSYDMYLCFQSEARSGVRNRKNWEIGRLILREECGDLRD